MKGECRKIRLNAKMYIDSVIKRFVESYDKLPKGYLESYDSWDKDDARRQAVNKCLNIASEILKFSSFPVDEVRYNGMLNSVEFSLPKDEHHVKYRLPYMGLKEALGEDGLFEELLPRVVEEYAHAEEMREVAKEEKAQTEAEKVKNTAKFNDGDFSGLIRLANTLQDEKNEMKSELERLKSEKSSAAQTSNSKEVQRLKAEIEELKAENDSLEKENEEKDEVISRLEKDVRTKNDEILGYKTEVSEVDKASTVVDSETYAAVLDLAYRERKYGVMNNNAFNRDVKEFDLKSSTFARVSICELKKINAKYGYKSGDNIIKNTAELLAENFGSTNVYRIYGDQFIIVGEETTDAKMYGILDVVRKHLEKDKTRIIFTAVQGRNFKSMKDIVSKMEEELKEIKDADHKFAEQQREPLEEKQAEEEAGMEDVDISSMIAASLLQ